LKPTSCSIPPPRDREELCARAEALAGRTVAGLARALGVIAPGGGVRTKGKIGQLVEKALGASAGSSAEPDFPALGIELKTVPIDAAGNPHESTFVCAISLADADRAEWETSAARAKLAHVLWVPVRGEPSAPASERILGAPIFWRPTAEQTRILRADFEELMGLVGIGGVEALTAHAGRYLQVRPKAAHGRVRTLAFGLDGERISTVPRGFYLRPRFTGALLRDPAAVPV